MINNFQNRINNAKRNESGFTLIELLVVIAILGILAGIVVFSVGGISDRGEKSACKSEIATLHTAQEANRAQNGNYAADAAALKTAGFLATAPSYYNTNNTGAVVAVAVPASCSAIPM